MSTLAMALLAQIEGAARAGDFGAVRHALARCAIGVSRSEFEAGEAGTILLAVREANRAMRDSQRRSESIAKAAKTAEMKHCANRAMRDSQRRSESIAKAAKTAEMKHCANHARVALTLDHIKRLCDWNWTTQLLAAGNKLHAQRSRARRS